MRVVDTIRQLSQEAIAALVAARAGTVAGGPADGQMPAYGVPWRVVRELADYSLVEIVESQDGWAGEITRFGREVRANCRGEMA